LPDTCPRSLSVSEHVVAKTLEKGMTQQVKQMRSVHINKEQEYKNADFN